MVIWLIGMSASGKTTIGKKLFERLQLSDEKWIFLDGDTFRNILGEDLGHAIEDRIKNAYRISRFCEYLDSQDINVVACVLSIFHDNQRYNKENISDYKEIYIDVEFEKLVQRDNKELYKKALIGEIKDVVGVDIKFNPPYSPDLIIDNNSDNPDYDSMINNIIDEFNIKLLDNYSYTKNNLLNIPQKYQYSKFEGEKFFDKFKIDRQNSLNLFTKRLEKLKIDYVYLENSGFIKEDSLVLKEFLIHLYNSDKNVLKEYLQTIELLIKRFEVSKKLYLTYDTQEVRKSSEEYNELLNYPLFSLVLQKYYYQDDTQKKFVYLNVILKLNDLISSIKSDFIVAEEIYYASLAINGEMNIIGEMI